MILQGSAPGGSQVSACLAEDGGRSQCRRVLATGFESADSKGCHLWRTGLGRREAQCSARLKVFLSRK